MAASRDRAASREAAIPKRATIADLAAAAGVSVATVDRVLNRRLPVSEATAARVAEAAEAISYHAAGLLKQRLAEAPPRAFAFLLQKRHDEFYQTLAGEVLAAAKAARFVRAKAQIVFIDELVPSVIAAKIRECGSSADAHRVLVSEVGKAALGFEATGKIRTTDARRSRGVLLRLGWKQPLQGKQGGPLGRFYQRPV
jgi:transcriptional regulator with XRE-family HTH domain